KLPWPIYAAGDGQAFQNQTALPPQVRALGRLGVRSMASCCGRASIYALPARYEPFGLSVLEAALAGCALVLGDIPSLRENWENAAVFVAPEDAEALGTAVQGLIEAPARRQTLGRRAAARSGRF